MKYFTLISLVALVVACKQNIPVVEIYDEVTQFAESGTTVTTGAKLILLKNADIYSRVKVESIQNGESTPLAAYDIKPVEHEDHGLSIRFYPFRKGVNQWSINYRTPSTEESIYYTDVEDGWRIDFAARSRYGRMNQDIEVLDSFVLFNKGKFFDVTTSQQYSLCDSVDDYLKFSKTEPEAKFVLMTLQKAQQVVPPNGP